MVGCVIATFFCPANGNAQSQSAVAARCLSDKCVAAILSLARRPLRASVTGFRLAMTSPRLMRALAVALVVAIGLCLVILDHRSMTDHGDPSSGPCTACEVATAPPPPLTTSEFPSATE